MHPGEPHARGSASRLNRLRAGVLGANDGIVSVAALVVGVAGATTASGTILTAGAAGLVGGAISMGLGEYVSVNSQRDSQQAMITEERRELKQHPEDERDELVRLYVAKGLTPTTAQHVAEQLTAKDPVAAHVDAELNLVSEEDIANPSAAGLTSAGSFAVGGALPFLTMLLLPSPTRVAATFIVVLLALALTGSLGARLGGSPLLRPTIRVVVGGAIALAVTFALGAALGSTGII
jgi:vacuolar iron transporter family protein